MEELSVKKGGLIYSPDYKVVLGVDASSQEFNGTIPYGAERIEEEAFSCSNVSKVIFPESVTSVGANLFGNCECLEFVHLPSSLKELSPYMFYGCSALKRIELPLILESMPEGLYAGCSSLEDVPFRNGLKELPAGIVDGCSSLKSLVLPDSVEKLCSGSVTNCEKLTTIVLSENLREIEADAVQNCPSLSRIRISDGNAYFETDEGGEALYRKGEAGSGNPVLCVSGRKMSEVCGFNEIAEDENPSIISYDESDDDNDDVDLIFNSANGDEASAICGNEEDGGNMSEEKSMEERLAEIMSQDKQYGEEDFSIMDIPEASEEELANNKLASSSEFDNTVDMGAGISMEELANMSSEPVDNRPMVERYFEEKEALGNQISEEEEKSMEDRLAEIMAQDKQKNDFSIMDDIPVASDAENSAGRVFTEEDEEAGIVPENALIANEPVLEEQVESNSDEKMFMQNLFFEAEKVEQQKYDENGDNQKVLYVFAQNLAENNIGRIFSKRLTSCCQRLAEVHGFSSIYYFYGIDISNEKFKNQLEDFMKEKDVLYACASANLSDIDDSVADFARVIGIQLTREGIENQTANANVAGSGTLKLLVQDNLAD